MSEIQQIYINYVEKHISNEAFINTIKKHIIFYGKLITHTIQQKFPEVINKWENACSMFVEFIIHDFGGNEVPYFKWY